MKRFGILFLILAVLLSSLGTVGVLAAPTVTQDGSSTIVTISALDGGELTGTWNFSDPGTDATAQANYGDYNGGKTLNTYLANATATWSAESLSAGYYKVEFWQVVFVYGSTARGAGHFSIAHRDGAATIPFDYSATANGIGWVNLGSYYFAGGSAEEFVRMTTANANIVRAGSVRFTPATPASEVQMTITEATDAALSAGITWAQSNPGDSTESQALYGGPNGEPTVYSGAKDGYAIFQPTELQEGYYDLSFFKVLYSGVRSRPVVKFEIYHNGETETLIFNFNEETADIREWMDLGTWYFSGDGTEYVKVINTTACTMRISSMKFTPAARQQEMEPDRGGIIVAEPEMVSGSWATSSAAEHPRLVTPLGTDTMNVGVTGRYAKYSAKALPEEGYYDVYWYKIVYAAAVTTKAQLDIYHDGRLDSVTVDYSSDPAYTTEWYKVGTYYFSGNAANEYVSVSNQDGAGILRIGGVKYVPVAQPTEDYSEVIVRATDEAHTNHHDTVWNESDAVLADDGSNSLYATSQGARFSFYADALTAGSYKVYYWRAPYTSGNDDSLWMTVNHSGKTDAFSFDYSNGEKEWVYIGEYDFAGGTKEEGVTIMRVQPHDVTGISTRITAVKFVKNAPAETDTFVVVPSTVAASNLTLNSGGGWVATDNSTVNHDGVFCVYSNGTDVYARYYLPTSGAEPGVYDVYLSSRPVNSSDDPAVTVTVAHSGETATTTFDNSQTAGYYKIGSYAFHGRGNNEYVELKRTTTDKTIRAGSVKFVRQADAEFVPGDTGLSVTANFGSSLASFSAALSETEKLPLAVRAAVYNNGPDTEAAPTVYAAVYGTDNTLQAIEILDTAATSIAPGETAHYACRLEFRNYTAGERVVLFTWKEGFVPVSGSIPLSVVE